MQQGKQAKKQAKQRQELKLSLEEVKDALDFVRNHSVEEPTIDDPDSHPGGMIKPHFVGVTIWVSRTEWIEAERTLFQFDDTDVR